MSSENTGVSIARSRRWDVIDVLGMFEELFRECGNYGFAGSEALDNLLSAKDDEELSDCFSEVWNCYDELSGIMKMYIACLSNIDSDKLKEALRDLGNEDNQ